MADIFPTGFFGARNAYKEFTPEQASESTCVLLGCGPVGLCALVNLLDYKPKHVFAVDSVDSRLEQARQLGAEPLNFMKDKEGMMNRVMEATNGRGADVVVEVVGLTPALRMAFEMVRNWGVISSIGVHNQDVSRVAAAFEALETDEKPRSRGRPRRAMARTCASSKAAARCDRFSPKPSRSCGRNTTSFRTLSCLVAS